MLVFQVFWFVAVLGGNRYAIPGAVVALILHSVVTQQLFIEWRILVAAAVMGFLLESAVVASGLVAFREQTQFAPIWLILLWAIFATTLNLSLIHI